MKKLINHIDSVLDESLDGFAAAHADIVVLGAERQFVRRRQVQPGKVAIRLASFHFGWRGFFWKSASRGKNFSTNFWMRR